MGTISPEKIYSVSELSQLTGWSKRNIERSVQRGAIRALRLSRQFYAIKGKDFLDALEKDRRGEIYLSKPLAV